MTPYLYILYHPSSHRIYVGSKYGKDAEPEQFMVTYFTSKPEVTAAILETGLSQWAYWIQPVPEARKLTVKQRMSAMQKLEWHAIYALRAHGGFNLMNTDTAPIVRETRKKKKWVTKGFEGKTHRADSRAAISAGTKGKTAWNKGYDMWEGNGPPNKGTTHKESSIELMRINSRGPHTEEHTRNRIASMVATKALKKGVREPCDICGKSYTVLGMRQHKQRIHGCS